MAPEVPAGQLRASLQLGHATAHTRYWSLCSPPLDRRQGILKNRVWEGLRAPHSPGVDIKSLDSTMVSEPWRIYTCWPDPLKSPQGLRLPPDLHPCFYVNKYFPHFCILQQDSGWGSDPSGPSNLIIYGRLPLRTLHIPIWELSSAGTQLG